MVLDACWTGAVFRRPKPRAKLRSTGAQGGAWRVGECSVVGGLTEQTPNPGCRWLTRHNLPVFAHVGATGATAPPSGRTGARMPPAARVWLRGRQFGMWDPPAFCDPRRKLGPTLIRFSWRPMGHLPEDDLGAAWAHFNGSGAMRNSPVTTLGPGTLFSIRARPLGGIVVGEEEVTRPDTHVTQTTFRPV